MANTKSPGSDGLTTELYKGFQNKVGRFVVRSLNHVYKARELSTPRNCIPKDGRSKFFKEKF